jgi:hypothetical protein
MRPSLLRVWRLAPPHGCDRAGARQRHRPESHVLHCCHIAITSVAGSEQTPKILELGVNGPVLGNVGLGVRQLYRGVSILPRGKKVRILRGGRRSVASLLAAQRNPI